MSAQINNRRLTDEELEDIGRRANDIYETRLKSVLEPEQNNRFVAIDLHSGDYTVGGTARDAMLAMDRLHADGQINIRKIGPEPEYGLAARILASDMVAGKI